MTKLWSAGYNRPGYLPDGDGVDPFESFGSAVQYIIEELELEAERQGEADDDSAAEQCDALIRDLMDCAKANKEWSGQAAGLEWWIKESNDES